MCIIFGCFGSVIVFVVVMLVFVEDVFVLLIMINGIVMVVIDYCFCGVL